MRLLYLKYILEQPEDSTISKMLKLQFEKPTPGYWARTCLNDLKYINLNITKEEIRCIPKQHFIKMLKEKISRKALDYLLEKRGKKGYEIEFSCMKIAEYLQPYNKQMNIEQQREMFAIRNKMVNIPIPANFSSKSEIKCICGEKEEMSHIYECITLSDKQQKLIPYTKIYNGNLTEQVYVYKKMSENLKNREKQCHPCGQSDPLFVNSKG